MPIPRGLVLAIPTCALVGALLLIARDAGAAGDDALWDSSSEEFVVTAAPRNADILDTPISVVEFDRETIETFGITDVRDAIRLIPNTESVPGFRGNSGITIRGINSEGFTQTGSLRTLSSLTIDGATQSFAGLRRGAKGLWDVQSFQVLKGPQSTLLGRNSLAGAIVVETADPTYEWEAALRTGHATLTNGKSSPNRHDQWNAAVMLSGPIVQDQLAFRFAGEIAEDDHGIRNEVPVIEPFDEGEYRQARGKILFQPNFLPRSRFEMTASYTRDDPAILEVTFSEVAGIDWDRYLDVGSPVVGRNLFATRERRRTDVLNVIGDARYDIGSGWSAHSVSSYTSTEVSFETPQPDVYFRPETREDADFTQDLRLTYLRNEALAVIVGGFFATTRNETDRQILLLGAPILDGFTRRETRTIALVFEGRWRPFESLTLSSGFRWDRDRYKVYDDDRQDDVQSSETRQTDALLPRFTARWRPFEDHTVVATVSRGYRAGFVDDLSRVDPEYLWNYEISYQASFLDGLVALDLNAFYYDWRDQQVVDDSANCPGFGGQLALCPTINVGESSVFGLEGVLTLNPIPGLIISWSGGYLDTEFDEFSGQPTDTRDGNNFPEAPRLSTSVLARYRHESGFRFSGDWTFRESFSGTGDVNNQRNLKIPGYHILNLRVGYDVEGIETTIYLRNALDNRYLTGRDNLDGAYVGDRRLLGAEITLRY